MVLQFPTPHIAASPSDFAKTVLMPGDPLRAKFIAETYLNKPKLINNIRGIQGYTGLYKDTRISVMASGMGIPSIGIYSYELFNIFNVSNIIRVGSAGAIREDVKIRDVIIAMGACTDSHYGDQFCLPGIFAPVASYKMLTAAVETAKMLNCSYKVGNLFSSDLYYDDASSTTKWSKMGVLAVEMEAAGLYMNAARSSKNALALCTVSNHLITGEELSADERERSFTNMIEIALETAVTLEGNDK